MLNACSKDPYECFVKTVGAQTGSSNGLSKIMERSKYMKEVSKYAGSDVPKINKTVQLLYLYVSRISIDGRSLGFPCYRSNKK